MSKILLVDDYYEAREIYTDLLKKAGHEVIAVGDGETAKNLILQQNFDLILLDMLLPKKNALEILDEIKNEKFPTPKNKIFVMSVIGQEELVKKAIESGIGGYIMKSNLSHEEVLQSIINKL